MIRIIRKKVLSSSWGVVSLDEVRNDHRSRTVHYSEIYHADDNLPLQGVILLPQNDDRLEYLNLHVKVCYARQLTTEELGSLPSPYDALQSDAMRRIMWELTFRLLTPSELGVKLVKSLLRHARKTDCIPHGDKGNTTKLCLKALHRQNYRDSNLVVDILSIWCSTSQQYVEQLFESEFYARGFIRYILESCAAFRFNFRNFIVNRPGRGPGSLPPLCPVLLSVVRGNDEFLRLLLEYGFKRYETHIDSRNWQYEYTTMSPILERHRVKNLFHHYQNYNEYLEHHRDHLIAQTLYMVCQSLLGRSEAWVQCARLVYESIPDPYLSETELYNAFRDNCTPQQRETICQTVKDLFSDIFVLIPTPRTLKQLTSCAIRRELADNFQLPSGINKLPLPNALLKYLTSLT